MVDADNRGRTPPLDANAKRWRKDGARAMTPKEKIKVHVQIERENARKLREWKEGGMDHETERAEVKESA